MHGLSRRRKPSEYRMQLLENKKQNILMGLKKHNLEDFIL